MNYDFLHFMEALSKVHLGWRVVAFMVEAHESFDPLAEHPYIVLWQASDTLGRRDHRRGVRTDLLIATGEWEEGAESYSHRSYDHVLNEHDLDHEVRCMVADFLYDREKEPDLWQDFYLSVRFGEMHEITFPSYEEQVAAKGR